MSPTTIIEEFIAERQRQEQKHGRREHLKSANDWIAMTAKYAGVGVTAPADSLGFALDKFRKQMVSVGALAITAIEWADRRIAYLSSKGVSDGDDAMPDMRFRADPRR